MKKWNARACYWGWMLFSGLAFADDSLIYQNDFEKPVAGCEQTDGKRGRAAGFNGVDQFVTIGDLGAHSQVTIMFWVRPDAKQHVDGDDYNGLVSSNAWEQGIMHFCYLGGRATCIVNLGAAGRAQVKSPQLPADKWTHVALTADLQNDRLKIYVNGHVAEESRRVQAAGAIKLVQQVIGAEHAATHRRFFHGAIDEVRMHNRALEPAEIRAECPQAPRIAEPTFAEKFRIQAALAKQEPVDRSVFPVYHYMAPFGNWFGDVNGPVFHEGWFHVFYQWRVPGEHKICWGHARSRDLIHWEHLPVAIPPRGSRGSWSGATVVTSAGPRILFTSDYQQLGSTGTPDLVHWKPMLREPAMSRSLHADRGVTISAWRDPFVWRHESKYFCCIGGSSGGRGYVSLYRARSDELDDWEFLGPLFVHPDSPDNACPNFFKVGSKWVLLMSRHRPHVEDWFVGDWDADTYAFRPQTMGILGYNEATYATQGLYHPDGRVIYWNTIHQWRRANKPVDWPGCLSVPRELSIGDDHRLRIRPLNELKTLRGQHRKIENVRVQDQVQSFAGMAGDVVEIQVTIEPQDAKSFGIVVRRSNDGTRGFELRYRDTVYVDGEEAMYSAQHGKAGDTVRKPYRLAEGQLFRATILLDRISFEAFVNDEICYDRLLHTCDHTGLALGLPKAEDLGIAVFAEEGSVLVRSLEVWKMNPIRYSTYRP